MPELFTRTVEPKEGEARLTAIVIHGLGSNEDDLLGFAGPLNLPIRLVAARAPISMPHGWGGGYAWYEFGPGGRPVLDGFLHGLAGLIRLVGDVKRHHQVDASNLIVLGFSQGAVMTMATALSIPDEIGGIVAMSGYFPEPEGWARPATDVQSMPVLLTHGVDDGIVPVQGSRIAAEKFRELGADVQYNEYAMAHEVSPECLLTVRQWLLERMESPQ